MLAGEGQAKTAASRRLLSQQHDLASKAAEVLADGQLGGGADTWMHNAQERVAHASGSMFLDDGSQLEVNCVLSAAVLSPVMTLIRDYLDL